MWSRDGALVYYIDTPRREVLAFDYTDGNLGNLRTAVVTGHIDAGKQPDLHRGRLATTFALLRRNGRASLRPKRGGRG